ncbi:hypothetical protein AMTR_s00036p00189610 [Amborella trichopoda]|uniref:Uncharacterized protein n=1 Tax=Amborella trichopoda TaxID=13333 RepID=U5CZF8_AMBTC|nr:hypothetical protein AMTR_s00036p00189610 [Amborella trichopoda]
MAGLRSSSLASMAVIALVFALVCGAFAAESPAPSPDSGAVEIIPGIIGGVVISVMAFFFGTFFN